MQLRLTKKFAADMKVDKLCEPVIISNPLDDWFIDVIRVARKKIAMITHAKAFSTKINEIMANFFNIYKFKCFGK